MNDGNTAGISLGTVFAAMHLLWITAVWAGIGQPVVDAVESAHFLSSTYTVSAFDPLTALLGIAGAFITGYATGWAFVYIHDLTGRKAN